MKIRLWLQNPPRVEWVMKVTHENDRGSVIVRTWFSEYKDRRGHPPPAVTIPAALACARIAQAALAGEVLEGSYRVLAQ